MRVTEIEFDGNLVVKCKLDVVAVHYVDPSWKEADMASLATRMGGGALIGNGFFPGVGLVGGAMVGLASFLYQKQEGYYDKGSVLRRSGALHRSDLKYD